MYCLYGLKVTILSPVIMWDSANGKVGPGQLGLRPLGPSSLTLHLSHLVEGWGWDQRAITPPTLDELGKSGFCLKR